MRTPAMSMMVDTWPAVTTPIFLVLIDALGGLKPDDLAAIALDARHFAVLDDVDAHGVGTARIAPGHGVMAASAAARLVIGAEDGIAAIRIIIDDRARSP